MRYCHEFRVGWSSQYGVVLRLPVDYLELEAFVPEVAWFAEDNAQRDLSERVSRQGRDDAVESCIRL